jgi:hypothetical protein
MFKGLDENLEAFKEEWNNASQISDRIKWAIFPTGDEEVEFQAAKQLMRLFDNLQGFIYFKEEQDPNVVIKALEDVLAEYKTRTTKDKIATAAAKEGYELHLGIE